MKYTRLFGEQSYIISNEGLTEFLCHGMECKYGRTTNIAHAIKFFPESSAYKAVVELMENNPKTDLKKVSAISITYELTTER